MAEKHRILLVDDEPSLIKIIHKLLTVEGYEVLIAKDGEEALQMARSEKPDLLLLDIKLPKLDGYQVCRQLKEDPQYRQIPIIMLSALAQEQDRERGFQAGTDAYMPKPFGIQELLDKIKEFIL